MINKLKTDMAKVTISISVGLLFMAANGYTQDDNFITLDVEHGKAVARMFGRQSSSPLDEHTDWVAPWNRAPLDKGDIGRSLDEAHRGDVYVDWGAAAAPLGTPELDGSFQGITFTGNFPPDPVLAAGPNGRLVAMTNGEISIFQWNEATSAGIPISAGTLEGFYGTTDAFDPKIIYDQYTGHFIAIALNGRNAPNSFLEVAVSKGSQPMNLRIGNASTDDWWQWQIDADLNDGAQTAFWADFPGLGIDQDYIYLTANMFWSDGIPNVGGTFAYTKIWIIPKSEVYQGNSSISVGEIWNIPDPSSGNPISTLQPAHSFDDFVLQQQLVARSSANGHMAVYRITNPGGIPSVGALDVVVDTWRSFAVHEAGQSGGAPLDAGDTRVLNAVFRNGSLYWTHTVPSGPLGLVSSVRFYRRLPDGGVIQQEYAQSSSWCFYPNIAVTEKEDVCVVFSLSNTSNFAAAAYSTAYAPGALFPETRRILQPGAAKYELFGGDGRNRWGDYGGTAVSPDEPNVVWMVHEYASAADTWATWIGRVTLPGIDVWVDFSYSSPFEFGYYEAPFNTIQEAIASSSSGAIVGIHAGAQVGEMTITQPVTLRAMGGSVTLRAQ